MAEVISLGEGTLSRSRASEVVHQETQVETRDYEDHTFAGDVCRYTRSKEGKLCLGPLKIPLKNEMAESEMARSSLPASLAAETHSFFWRVCPWRSKNVKFLPSYAPLQPGSVSCF